MKDSRLVSAAMRAGPMSTAVITWSLTLAFLKHESPPTIGHMVAAVLVAVPTVVVFVAAVILTVSSRNAARLLLLQLVATGAALGALLSQRSHPPLLAWLAALGLLGAPVVSTAIWVRWRQRVGPSTATPPTG